MSLNPEEVEQEQNEMKDLQRQLKETTNLVKNLSSQLNDLREKVIKFCTFVCVYYGTEILRIGRERRGREGEREILHNSFTNQFIFDAQMVEQRKIQQQRTIQTQMPLQVNPHHSRMASYPAGTM